MDNDWDQDWDSDVIVAPTHNWSTLVTDVFGEDPPDWADDELAQWAMAYPAMVRGRATFRLIRSEDWPAVAAALKAGLRWSRAADLLKAKAPTFSSGAEITALGDLIGATLPPGATLDVADGGARIMLATRSSQNLPSVMRNMRARRYVRLADGSLERVMKEATDRYLIDARGFKRLNLAEGERFEWSVTAARWYELLIRIEPHIPAPPPPWELPKLTAWFDIKTVKTFDGPDTGDPSFPDGIAEYGVKFPHWDPAFVAVAKHYGGRWDPDRRCWWLPALKLGDLLCDLEKMSAQLCTNPGKTTTRTP